MSCCFEYTKTCEPCAGILVGTLLCPLWRRMVYTEPLRVWCQVSRMIEYVSSLKALVIIDNFAELSARQITVDS